MSGQMIVIATDGTKQMTQTSVPPTLVAVQQAVNGYVQPVPLFTAYAGQACEAYCDEEGKLKRAPRNEVATQLWQELCGPHEDFLCGPIVILLGDARWSKERDTLTVEE